MHLDKNLVTLQGEVISEVTQARELKGVRFVTFFVGVKRLSGYVDKLLVLAKDAVVPKGITVGTRVSIKGQFRVYRNFLDFVKTRYAYVVYSTDMQITEDTQDINEIELVGFPVKIDKVRSTQTGRSLRDVVIVANNYFRHSDGSEASKSNYLNCLAWSNTMSVFDNLSADTYIGVSGRIQSRPFKKADDPNDYVAYEISIGRVLDISEESEKSKKSEKSATEVESETNVKSELEVNTEDVESEDSTDTGCDSINDSLTGLTAN